MTLQNISSKIEFAETHQFQIPLANALMQYRELRCYLIIKNQSEVIAG